MRSSKVGLEEDNRGEGEVEGQEEEGEDEAEEDGKYP